MTDITDIDENPAIPDEIAAHEPTETPINYQEKVHETEAVKTTDEPSTSEPSVDEPEKNIFPIDEANDKGIQCELLQIDSDESRKTGNLSKDTEKINVDAQSNVTTNNNSSTTEEQNSSEEKIPEATERLNEETIENSTSSEKEILMKMEKDDAESRCEPIIDDNMNESSAIPKEDALPELTETHVSGSEKSNETVTDPVEPTDEPSSKQSTTDQPEKSSSPTDKTLEKGHKTAGDESNKSENISKETAEINFEAQSKVITQNDTRRIEDRILLEEDMLNEETVENKPSEKDPPKEVDRNAVSRCEPVCDKANQDLEQKSECELPSKSIVQELKKKLEQSRIENSKLEGKVQVLDEKYQNIMEMHCDVLAAYQVEKTKIIQEYEGKIRDVVINKTLLEEQIKQAEAADNDNVQNVSVLKENEKTQKDTTDTKDLENDVAKEENCSSKESLRNTVSKMDEETKEACNSFPKTVEEEEEHKEKLKLENEKFDSKMTLSEVNEETKEACSTFPMTVEEEEEHEEKFKLETEEFDLKRPLSEVEEYAKHVLGEDEISKTETIKSPDISGTNLVEMQTKINELHEVTKSLQKQLDVLKNANELNESSVNETKMRQEDGSYKEESSKDISKEKNLFLEKEKEVQEYDYFLQTKSSKSHLAKVEEQEESTETFFPKTLDEFGIAIKQADEEYRKRLEKLENEKAKLIKQLTQTEEQLEYHLEKDRDSKTKTKQSSGTSGTDLVEMESKINELQKVIKSLQEQLDKMKNGNELNEPSIIKIIQEDVQNRENSNKDIKDENCSPEKEKEIQEHNKMLKTKSSKSALPDVKEQIKDSERNMPKTVEEFDILIRQTEKEYKERQNKLETEKANLEQMLKEQEKQYLDENKTKTPESSNTSEYNLSAMKSKIDELQEVLKSLQLELEKIKNVNEINEPSLDETKTKQEEEKNLKESKESMTIEEKCPLKSKDVFQDDDKMQKMTTPENPLSEKEKNECEASLSKTSVEVEILVRKTKEEHSKCTEAEETELELKKQLENFVDRDRVEMQSKIDELQKVIKSLEEKNESTLIDCREKLADMEASKETAIQNFELQIKNLMEEKENLTRSNKNKETDSVCLRTTTAFIESNYDKQVVEVRAEMREKCAIEAKHVEEVTTQAVVKKYEEMLAQVNDMKQEILNTFTESVKSYEVNIHDIHMFYEQKLESLRQQKEHEQCAAAQNQIEALQKKCKDLETHYKDVMDEMKSEMEEKWENKRREMEVNFDKEKEVLKTNYENAVGEMENEMKENWENERKEIKATFEKEKEVLETQYKGEMNEMKNKTNERLENEKRKMEAKFEKEKLVLETHYKDEMDEMKNETNESWENERREMEAKFEKEKEELESHYKDQMDKMKNKANERWENEKKEMEAKFEKEKHVLESHYKDEMDEMKNKGNESWENEKREMEAKFEKEKEVLVGQNEKGEQEYESKINELSETYERKISQMALDHSALEEKYYAAIKQLEEILGSMKMPRECAASSCVTTIICSRCSNKEINKIEITTSADEYSQLNHTSSKESQTRNENNSNKEDKNENEISTTKDDQNEPISILRDKDNNKERSIENNKIPKECNNLPDRENKNSTLVFESNVLSSSSRECLIGSTVQETSPATIKKNNGFFPAVKKETTGKQKDRGKNSNVLGKPFIDFQKSLKMLKEKQELEELLKSLQNEISQEQFNFLQAMQFKKDGQFDELSQSSAKRMVEEKLHLETELKIVTQEILNLLEDNGLQRNSKKIAAKAKQKDEIELSLEILEENVNAEPMRAAEALTCLLETKTQCQEQLEALDKGLKQIKEEIELKLKHEKSFVNNLPEQLILELCLSP